MSHANARFTPAGRLLIVQRIEAGMPQAHVARQMGPVSRHGREVVASLARGGRGRSGVPVLSALALSAAHRRQARGAGVPAAAQHPARSSVSGGAHRATGVDGVADPQAQRTEPPVMDRAAHRARYPPLRALRSRRAGAPRHQEGRQDSPRPGLARARPRLAASEARQTLQAAPVGYTLLHVAVDDYSRVAYVEAHDNETAATLVGFWQRAQNWFWSNDMAVDEVMTDNGPDFVSDAFAELLAERRIRHRRTRPYRPQANCEYPRCALERAPG